MHCGRQGGRPCVLRRGRRSACVSRVHSWPDLHGSMIQCDLLLGPGVHYPSLLCYQHLLICAVIRLHDPRTSAFLVKIGGRLVRSMRDRRKADVRVRVLH